MPKEQPTCSGSGLPPAPGATSFSRQRGRSDPTDGFTSRQVLAELRRRERSVSPAPVSGETGKPSDSSGVSLPSIGRPFVSAVFSNGGAGGAGQHQQSRSSRSSGLAAEQGQRGNVVTDPFAAAGVKRTLGRHSEAVDALNAAAVDKIRKALGKPEGTVQMEFRAAAPAAKPAGNEVMTPAGSVKVGGGRSGQQGRLFPPAPSPQPGGSGGSTAGSQPTGAGASRRPLLQNQPQVDTPRIRRSRQSSTA